MIPQEPDTGPDAESCAWPEHAAPALQTKTLGCRSFWPWNSTPAGCGGPSTLLDKRTLVWLG